MAHPEHASPALLEWNGELRLIRCSSRAAELFGWNMHQMIGRTPATLYFLSEQDRTELHERLARLARTGDAHDTLHLQGPERSFLWHNHTLADGGGGTGAIVSIVTEAITQPASGRTADVTEEASASGEMEKLPLAAMEAAGDEHHSHAWNALRQAATGIGIFTADGKWELANPALCSLFGVAPEELATTTYRSMVYGDDPEPDLSYIDRLLAGDLPIHRFEILHADRNGAARRLSLAVTPLQEDSASGRRLLVQAQEITEQRAGKMLREAGEAAEATDRTKSEFLAMMRHEIRMPMNAVIDMTNLLLESELAPPQREYVKTLHNSSATLLRLLNDVLDPSKMTSGRLDLEHHPFELERCIADAIAMAASGTGVKGPAASYTIAENAPSILIGDSIRLQQILVNLLDVSMKFARRDRIDIRVASREIGEEEYEITFAVHDTGTGISREYPDQIFTSSDRIGRHPQARTDDPGIAICRLLAEMMHGRIWAESDEERGSTFYFTIIAQGLVLRHRREALEALKGGRLLVVADDDGTSREIVRQTRLFDMTSVAVTSLRIAAELLALDVPLDAMIVDCRVAGFRPDLVRSMAQSRGERLVVILLARADTRPGRQELAAIPRLALLDVPLRRSALVNALLGLLVGDSEQSAPEPARASDTHQDAPAREKAAYTLHEALGTKDERAADAMIDQYLNTTEKSIIRIRLKCAERNTTELVRIAHMLQSSSRIFGSPELSDLFAQLEQMGQAGTLGEAEELLTTIVAEFKQVRQRLAVARADGGRA